MKKNILFFAALLSFCSVFAQKSEYPTLRGFWMFDYTSYASPKEKEKISNAKIIGYNETLTNDKKTYLWQTISYDAKGNSTAVTYRNSKGKINDQYLYTYNSDNKVICSTRKNNKGIELNKVITSYDKLGNISEEINYYKGKEISKTNSTYDSLRILESYFYKKGSKDFTRKWVYTYYPDKSKKSSVIYDAKGKVLYTWNYECKPEGELASKHKDTTEVCKNEEIDKDGNKITTSRRFNEKGKPYKVVYKKNKNNQMLEYSVYHENNQLSSYYKYTDEGKMEEYGIYNEKGREIFKTIYSYDANNNQTGITSFKKGSMTYKWTYSYNTMNFVEKMDLYKKGGELQSSYKYDYLYSN
jgi:hypothetical protein